MKQRLNFSWRTKISHCVPLLSAFLAFASAEKAFADPHDGTGTMKVSPTNAVAGTTGNSFTFSFIEGTPGNFPDNSTVTIAVPLGWTAPQTNNASLPGYVSATATGSDIVHSFSASGSGPWTITVVFKGHDTVSGFNLTYAGGGTKVTAPTSPAVYTFTTKSQGGTGGTIAAIAASPTITVGSSLSLTITNLGNGSFLIKGNGFPGYTYRLQHSDTSVPFVWQALTNVTANSVGAIQFTNTSGSPMRFYRTVYP